MRLINKHTGEIATLTLSSNGEEFLLMKNSEMITRNVKLSDLKEWEDYEEPKEYWYLENNGEIVKTIYEGNLYEEKMQEVGNYFSTKKEAEKAVEKLKAWKRLKDKGFRFDGWDENHHNLGIIEFSFDKVENNVWNFEEDLDLLFGGEE